MNIFQPHRWPNRLLRFAQQVLAYKPDDALIETLQTADVPVATRRLQTISAVGKLAASGFGKPSDISTTVRIAAAALPHRTPSRLVRPRLGSTSPPAARLVALR